MIKEVIQIGILPGNRRTNLYSRARQCPRKMGTHIYYFMPKYYIKAKKVSQSILQLNEKAYLANEQTHSR